MGLPEKSGGAVGLERSLSIVLGTLMAAQAGLGLLMPDAYRDAAWAKAAWFGNDLVTLLVAVPLLFGAMRLASRGSMRARLVWLGVLGYAVYDYAYYVLGAELNVFFALYVLAFVVAVASLVVGLAGTDAASVARAFPAGAPARAIGGFYAFFAAGVAAVWLGTWAAYAFAGRPTPIDTEAFHLIAALDMSLMVPALAIGGVLLWRRRPWGYVIAAVAGAQASLYLLVLAVDSAVSVSCGIAFAQGEVPIWSALAVLASTVTVRLIRACDASDGPIQRTAWRIG